MMPLGQLAPVAQRQLAAWEELARDWAVAEGVTMEDPKVYMARCASCFGGIYRLTDDTGTAYQYSPEQILALTVAHLRQAHLELDPDRG